jgi:flagellar motor switch protein FliM
MAVAETVLSRKLRHGGVARSPLPDTDLIGETYARFVEDRLRPILKTIIGAMVIDCRVAKLSDAISTISIPAMLGLVEVEEADTPALLNIDSDLAYHLIDLTLGGDPAAAPPPTTRSFTAIDMALCRIHLEAVLAGFDDALAINLGRPLTRKLTIKDQRQNISQLRLAPDYVDVLVISVGLDIGEAARTGQFDLILPLSTLDVIRAAMEAPGNAEAKARPDDLWKLMMRRAAATAPVHVDAVLDRQRLSLATIQRLQTGHILEIPAKSPQEVQLTIGQPEGRTAVIAIGRLGVYDGKKVLKLETPPDPRVKQHVDRALDTTVKRALPSLPPMLTKAETAVPETDDQAAS